MAISKVTLSAAAPAPNEAEVQSASDSRAGKRDQFAHPFFGGFLPEFGGQALRDAGSNAFEQLFFYQVFPEVHTCSRGGGQPELRLLLGALGVESVQQAEALNEAQGDDGEKTCIRHEGEDAA